MPLLTDDGFPANTGHSRSRDQTAEFAPDRTRADGFDAGWAGGGHSWTRVASDPAPSHVWLDTSDMDAGKACKILLRSRSRIWTRSPKSVACSAAEVPWCGALQAGTMHALPP